jgi:hypothetical protein
VSRKPAAEFFGGSDRKHLPEVGNTVWYQYIFVKFCSLVEIICQGNDKTSLSWADMHHKMMVCFRRLHRARLLHWTYKKLDKSSSSNCQHFFTISISKLLRLKKPGIKLYVTFYMSHHGNLLNIWPIISNLNMHCNPISEHVFKLLWIAPPHYKGKLNIS